MLGDAVEGGPTNVTRLSIDGRLLAAGRENSLAAIEHYTQRKLVSVATGHVEAPY